MNPFDLDQNDLIAYHLQELPLRRQRALHRLIQNNAAVAAESEAIAATLRAFPKDEAALPINAAALERHWLALRPLLVVHFPKPFARRSLLLRWALPTLAGFAFATTALLISLHHGRHTQPSTVATIATPPSAIPTPSPSTGSNSTFFSSAQPNASAQRPWIINRPWPSPSTPTQPDNSKTGNNPQTSLNVPPPQPSTPQTPAQLSPEESSLANTSAPPTEGAASLSSNTSPTPSSTPSSTPSNTVRKPSKVHHSYPSDLTLGIFGDLIAARASTYISDTGDSFAISSRLPITQSAFGALASFHQQFTPWLGYRITTTYSHPTFQYSYSSSSSPAGAIDESTTVTDSIYELSGTYVVRGPHRGRLTTSAEAGAGLLAFLQDNQITDKVFRPAATVGVSADIALTKHWALHTGYRALLYNSPAFSTPSFKTSPTYTFSSNPVVGITYRFGARSND